MGGVISKLGKKMKATGEYWKLNNNNNNNTYKCIYNNLGTKKIQQK